MKPESLKCDYAAAPVDIATPQPRFYWTPRSEWRSSARAGRQRAYRILVSADRATLESERGEVWDSGRIESDRSIHIPYDGAPLKSLTDYYWTVRLWDDENLPGPFAAPERFGTGLLSESEWRAHWMTRLGHRPGTATLFRGEVTVPEEVRAAKAIIATPGYYELRINGAKVGDHVLDPAPSEARERVFSVVHDAASHLRIGVNVLGIVIGDGWYPMPLVRFQLHLTYRSGRTQTIFYPGESHAAVDRMDRGVGTLAWVTTSGPWIEHSIYDGEVYDATAVLKGWDAPGFDARDNDGLWHSVHYARGPGGVIVGQSIPPIRVTETAAPITVATPIAGVYVVDFGRNIAGWCGLRIPHGAVDPITVRYAELLADDGSVNQRTLRTAKARDRFIPDGGDERWYEPSFTYHGFRYVQIEGYPRPLEVADIIGRMVGNDVERVGSVETSSDLLNRIHDAIVLTERNNLHGVPTDCPQRDERFGWLNDATVRAEAAVYNFDLARFYRKWLADIRDAQDPLTGAVSDTAPYRYGFRPGDPVSCYVVMLWNLYLFYGDVEVVREYYRSAGAWVDFLLGRTEDGIVDYTRYGDWCTPITDCFPKDVGDPGPENYGAVTEVGSYPAATPGTLVSTAYLIHNLKLLARMATVVGAASDADRYETLRQRTITSFNRRFFNAATAQYGSGSQGCNVMALFAEAVPAERRAAVVAHVVRDVVELHDGHLNTGNQATKYLVEILTREGYVDVAYEILTKTTYPSWGFMLQRGATTIWERWEELSDVGMNSRNHPMMGSVDAWFYNALAGIRPDWRAPGFKRVVFEPHTPKRLHSARVSYRSVSGEIRSEWRREGDRITYRFKVPVGSSGVARLELPNDPTAQVSLNGETIWDGAADDTFGEQIPRSNGDDRHAERPDVFREIGRGGDRIVVPLEPGEHTGVVTVATDRAEDRITTSTQEETR